MRIEYIAVVCVPVVVNEVERTAVIESRLWLDTIVWNSIEPDSPTVRLRRKTGEPYAKSK